MNKKVTFVLLFSVVHGFATLVMFGDVMSRVAPDTWWGALCKIVTTVFNLPLVLPIALMDPDGELLPKWLQISSVFVNSLLWAVVALLVMRSARRVRERRQLVNP